MRSSGTASAARALAGPNTSARAPAAKVAPVSLKKPRLERFTLTSIHRNRSLVSSRTSLCWTFRVLSAALLSTHGPCHRIDAWTGIPPGRSRRSVCGELTECPRRLQTRGVGGREEKMQQAPQTTTAASQPCLRCPLRACFVPWRMPVLSRQPPYHMTRVAYARGRCVESACRAVRPGLCLSYRLICAVRTHVRTGHGNVHEMNHVTVRLNTSLMKSVALLNNQRI